MFNKSLYPWLFILLSWHWIVCGQSNWIWNPHWGTSLAPPGGICCSILVGWGGQNGNVHVKCECVKCVRWSCSHLAWKLIILSLYICLCFDTMNKIQEKSREACFCADVHMKNVQSAVVAQYVIDNAWSCAFEDYCFFSSNRSNYQPSGCRKIIQTLKRELLIASNYAEWLLDYHYWSLLRLLPINPFSQPSPPALSDAVDSLGTYLWR